jgi:hypothetical protein
MKKEYIIGAVALAAVVGGYFWWKSKNKVIATIDEPTLDTPKGHPLEGQVIAIGSADGKYNGSAVFFVYEGKKYSMPSSLFDEYVKNNGYDKMKIISQQKLDAIPQDGNIFSPETIIGSAKVKGLYDGKDIYLGDVATGLSLNNASSVFHIKGDKKYTWTSPDWTVANKSNQMAVTQDVLDMFSDGGTYKPNAIDFFESALEIADGNVIKGWTGSRKNNVPTPDIDIYINDKKVETVKPSTDRPELDSYLNSNTGMNFEYKPKDLKSGETYKINAKYAGTKKDIRYSPMTFTVAKTTAFSGVKSNNTNGIFANN